MAEKKSNTATLSTGIEVSFTPIPQNAVQDLVLASFSGMDLNNMGEGDVLKHGDKILRYNTTLIQEGVYLVTPLVDAIKMLGLNNNWFKALLRSGKVLDIDLYDRDDNRDKEILFLRFHAFKTEDDFKILTEKLLGNG